MTNSAKTIIRTLFFTLVACAAVTPRVVAQDATSKKIADSEDSTPKDEHSKARRDLMVQALEKYSVILNGKADKPATLDSSTLLRYSNPLGDVADGVLSVFGDPVAPFYTSSYRGDAGEATFLALLPKQ